MELGWILFSSFLACFILFLPWLYRQLLDRGRKDRPGSDPDDSNERQTTRRISTPDGREVEEKYKHSNERPTIRAVYPTTVNDTFKIRIGNVKNGCEKQTTRTV